MSEKTGSEKTGFSGSQVALAFFGGALAGAAIGVLTAPKAGRETRQELSERIHRGKAKTARIPKALKSASGAARHAFEDAMTAEQEEQRGNGEIEIDVGAEIM